MLSLLDVVEIKEESETVVSGLFRGEIYPLDILPIESKQYRINFLQKLPNDLFKFKGTLCT